MSDLTTKKSPQKHEHKQRSTRKFKLLRPRVTQGISCPRFADGYEYSVTTPIHQVFESSTSTFSCIKLFTPFFFGLNEKHGRNRRKLGDLESPSTDSSMDDQLIEYAQNDSNTSGNFVTEYNDKDAYDRYVLINGEM